MEPRPWFMNGLKLRYLLAELRSVHGKVLDLGCGAGAVAKAVKRARPDLDVPAVMDLCLPPGAATESAVKAFAFERQHDVETATWAEHAGNFEHYLLG